MDLIDTNTQMEGASKELPGTTSMKTDFFEAYHHETSDWWVKTQGPKRFERDKVADTESRQCHQTSQ